MTPIELLDPFALAAAVVIPIRSFTFGKQRLGDALTDSARHDLARSLADQVANAAGRLSTIVVTSDDEVVEWSTARLAFVISDPGTLSAAAAAGRNWAAEHGLETVIVAHADLPFADDFERLLRPGFPNRCVIIPDRLEDGNPVINVPARGPFEFSYGVGSFQRHCATARTAGFDVEILRDHALGFDVDEPDDLALLRDAKLLG